MLISLEVLERLELLEVSQMKVTQGSLARLAGKLPVLEECLEWDYLGLSALVVVRVQLAGDLVQQLVGDPVVQLGLGCKLCLVVGLVAVL